ncbi:MAG TPA: helix-turn-helix transcriptional regulator [Candidatus Woesebacteria bacterium]|nr:helix-turn-helix transcriptional regulator [Candidatus Woesebacteria bacterium]
MNTIKFEDYLNQQLKKDSFRKEWKKSETQYQLTRQLIKARIEQGYNQRQLAKKAKTTQAVLSRLESMSFNPSLGLIEKIAKALGKKVEIKLG